jgi:LuxR family maltose regulon positive regulatory protein
MKLHLRAADWYESSGSPAMALEHLLNTAGRERCVRLVAQLLLPTYQVGQMSTVQRWLSALGDTAIAEYPPLAVLAGWITVLTGQTVEAQRWAAVVRRRVVRPGARRRLGVVRLGAGHTAGPDVRGRPGADGGRRELRGRPGAAVEAAGCVEAALAAVDKARMRDYATSAPAFAAAARLAVRRGDMEGANRELTRAMRARPSLTFVFPYLAVRLRLQLAKVYWAIADYSAARHLLREMDDIVLHRPALGALGQEISEFRRIVTSNAQGGPAGGSPLTPAELRLLPYLQTHLTMGEIGERLFVSRNTVSSQVTSIYRKLGVSSRNDAVTQATTIGLLGG